MKLYLTRSLDEDRLKNKELNLAIGISIGNKWFTPENVYDLTKWALEHTKDWLLIYVADSIHSINIEVRKRVSKERAEKIAGELGEKILNNIKRYLEENLSKEELGKIVFSNWDKLDPQIYIPMKEQSLNFYKNNKEFKNEITNIVKEHTKDEDRIFSESDIEKLGTYLVEELPEITTKIPMDGYKYDAFIYPYDGEIAQLANEIQKGEKYPELLEKLKGEPMGFIVAR